MLKMATTTIIDMYQSDQDFWSLMGMFMTISILIFAESIWELRRVRLGKKS